MLSITDTTLNLLVLQLVLHGAGLGGLLLGVLSPVGTWLEDDVLSDRGGVWCWAGLILLRLPELRPGLALGDTWVDDLFHEGCADAACSLNFLAIVVQSPGNSSDGSVLVGSSGVRWKLVGGLIELVVVGPVLPTNLSVSESTALWAEAVMLTWRGWTCLRFCTSCDFVCGWGLRSRFFSCF